MQVVVVTMGEGGCLVVRRGAATDPLPLHNDPSPVLDPEDAAAMPCSARHYPVPPPADIVSVNGAGDCFAAAFLASALSGRAQDRAVAAGMQAAARCMRSGKAVPHSLAAEDIDWEESARGTDVKL